MNNKKDTILNLFTCQQSGNCCKRPGYVYVTQADIQNMADYLTMSVADFTTAYVIRDNGWPVIATPTHRPNCFVTNTNQCGIYPVRPIECRTYPNWPSIWESDESLQAEASKCPALKAALKKVKTQD